MKLENHRMILVSEKGVPVAGILVHNEIPDAHVQKVIRRYRYECLLRIVESKIEREKTGKSVGDDFGLNVYRRLNLLAKLIRLDPIMNGLYVQRATVINGRVYDVKDINMEQNNKEIKKMNKHDRDMRVIETQEEKAWMAPIAYEVQKLTERCSIVGMVPVDAKIKEAERKDRVKHGVAKRGDDVVRNTIRNVDLYDLMLENKAGSL